MHEVRWWGSGEEMADAEEMGDQGQNILYENIFSITKKMKLLKDT